MTRIRVKNNKGIPLTFDEQIWPVDGWIETDAKTALQLNFEGYEVEKKTKIVDESSRQIDNRETIENYPEEGTQSL